MVGGYFIWVAVLAGRMRNLGEMEIFQNPCRNVGEKLAREREEQM